MESTTGLADWDVPLLRYDRLTSSLQSVETPVLVAIGATGFVGACFSLATFLRESSSPNDYFLYKIVSACEAAQMFVLTIVRSTSFFNCERSYACSFFWAHVSLYVMNACADIVDLLILFLCIERTWACLLPFAFKTVNRRLLERSVAGLASLFMVVFSSFQAFELRLQYDHEEGRYHGVPSEFAGSRFYAGIIMVNAIRFYATAFAIAIATAFSLFGFYRTSRRSKALTKSADKKREMDLCCLQLCTAAPVVINHLLYAISLRFGHYSFSDQQPLAENATMSYVELNERLRKAEIFQYLKTSTNISDALAHALQFYFYLLFCMKIRQAFFALWKCKRDDVTGKKRLQAMPEAAAMLPDKHSSA